MVGTRVADYDELEHEVVIVGHEADYLIIYFIYYDSQYVIGLS